ncbi:hypothetical protein CSE16_02595 [Solibacillus sp. R5-41]|nr:hypothetical protein CSE16_02595 [Solibacillus sp. R5-41]
MTATLYDGVTVIGQVIADNDGRIAKYKESDTGIDGLDGQNSIVFRTEEYLDTAGVTKNVDGKYASDWLVNLQPLDPAYNPYPTVTKVPTKAKLEIKTKSGKTETVEYTW